MKQKLIISLIILFVFYFFNCGTPDHIPKQVNYYGFDFTKYSAQDFLFTPEKYNGEYESVGILEVEIFPEVFRTKKQAEDAYYPWEGEVPWWFTEKITSEEILDSLFSLSKNMGANAIINLQISTVTKSYRNLTIEGKKASGFAVKR